MAAIARLWPVIHRTEMMLNRTEIIIALLYYGVGLVYYLTVLSHHQM